MNRDNALLMFVKAPKHGQVKTRLQPELTHRESLLLYRAMVEDLVANFQNLTVGELIVVYWPPDAKVDMQRWLGNRYQYIPQRGRDLGERMHLAFDQMFKKNYKKVVIIGSDLPILDKAIITKAFSNLDEGDVVLGPSTDGGYYLVGMKESHIELFENINWSTNLVLQQTLRKCQLKNLSVLQLKELTDIDTYPDVLQLWHFLKKTKRSAEYLSLTNTYRVLNKFFTKLHIQ